MLSVSPAVKIFLYAPPADLRRGYDGLAAIVQGAMDEDPLSGWLFLFVNKRRNQIKVLYWQRTGFCLWLKRLEEERFKWPFHLEGPVVELASTRMDQPPHLLIRHVG